MAIIIHEGYRQTAEREFVPSHPDTFSSALAALLVSSLAVEANKHNALEELRVDINVQVAAGSKDRSIRPMPVRVSFAGQIELPGELDLEAIAKDASAKLLKQAGYLDNGDFSSSALLVDLSGITSQSPHLNGTSRSNKYADSCRVVGHYLASPYGINGTFPSLAAAITIERCLDKIIAEKQLSTLRPDGKVHITGHYSKEDFVIDDVYLSIANAKDFPLTDLKGILEQGLRDADVQISSDVTVSINEGGPFDLYFVQADSGVSKAKDDVIITGGLQEIGTDRIWGKCLYKASSILLPYAFALSRAVTEAAGALYASVSAFAKYGQETAFLQLEEIDPATENKRQEINNALSRLPRDPKNIRDLLSMPVSLATYQTFNDVQGFHDPDKPWKAYHKQLVSLLKDALRRQ